MALTGLGAIASTSTDSFASVSTKVTGWQPDGAGHLGRIGLLTLDFDPVPESEMQAIAPRGVSIHASRVKYIRGMASSYAEAPNADNASELLMRVNPSVILSAFTSSSYVIGKEADREFQTRLESQTNGIPVIFTCNAAIEAFQSFQASKIALIHPPWFSDEINLKGKAYFESLGFEVAFCKQVGPHRDFTEVSPAEVYEWIITNAPRNVDLIYVSGNGLRMAGAIAKLEQKLKLPVLSANQVLLWAALRRIGVSADVKNYGKVFRQDR